MHTVSSSLSMRDVVNMNNKRRQARHAVITIAWIIIALFVGRTETAVADTTRRPNILLAISDDQSYMHTGANGDAAVDTPAFDRIAGEGVRFTQAYTACPSCTPSRSAVLTGQAIYRLEEGGLLFGTLPAKFPVYPRLLEEGGYRIGYTGKGWGPGDVYAGGRTKYPIGKAYQERLDQPRAGMSPIDYAASFERFLDDRDEADGDQPFCFWYGASEPHLGYKTNQGLEAGKRLEEARLPAGLPDVRTTRRDLLDYYVEIEHFDTHLQRMLRSLEKRGELDNTIVIVTSDHGNPFPRSKCNMYDTGTRVPLAIRWPDGVRGGRVVDDFVSLTDLAPTLLDYAGVEIPSRMTGRSLRTVLETNKTGWTGMHRDYVVVAFERHTPCRTGSNGYPMRMIRTRQFMYIRNYEPQRWPAGSPDIDSIHQGFYGDVDRSPTKSYMIEHRDDPAVAPYFVAGFAKRPAHELYDVREDPGQMRNLADESAHGRNRDRLAAKLIEHLKLTGDPRMDGRSPWGSYPYYHRDFAEHPEKLP